MDNIDQIAEDLLDEMVMQDINNYKHEIISEDEWANEHGQTVILDYCENI